MLLSETNPEMRSLKYGHFGNGSHIILEPVETILEMVMTNLWLIDISLKLVGTIMELAVTSCECFSQKKTQSLNVHLPTHIFSSHHYLCLRFFLIYNSGVHTNSI